jgi:ABC-type sugar transport system permease subunit
MHPFYFAVPAAVIFFVFFLLPILFNVVYSFTNWSTYSYDVSFVGLQNFREIFSDRRFINAFKNAIFFTITVVAVQNLVGFSLACALHNPTRLNEVYRAIFFVPCVIAIVVWGYLFTTILHPTGLLNGFLSLWSVNTVRITWLGSVHFTIFVVALVNVWIWSGFTMMIYITSINAIPVEIFEAARIDGTGWPRMITRIILPIIIPGLTVNIVLSIIGGLKVFDIIMVLTKGGPGRATEVFNTLIYETFAQGRLGYAGAVNLLLIILISAIAFPVYINLSKRAVEA